MPKSDIIVMVLVTLVTAIVHNLALAVLVGVIISALVFAWDNAQRIRARKYVDDNGIKHYEIYGPLYFGSVTAFNEKFDLQNDPEEVIIDFEESRVVDMSAIEALNKLSERYLNADKKLHLKHLSPDCIKLLKNAEQIIALLLGVLVDELVILLLRPTCDLTPAGANHLQPLLRARTILKLFLRRREKIYIRTSS